MTTNLPNLGLFVAFAVLPLIRSMLKTIKLPKQHCHWDGTLLSRILAFSGLAIANSSELEWQQMLFRGFSDSQSMRRLVGEGSLTIHSFLSIRNIYPASEEETRKVTHAAFTIAGVVLLILTVLELSSHRFDQDRWHRDLFKSRRNLS